jgi:hypothetical protein
MTNSEHEDFARRANADEVLIGVEPAIARRLLMNSSSDTLNEEIGERLTLERTVVTAAYWLGSLAVLASIPTAVLAFSWWSIVIIPVTAIACWVYYGKASSGRQKLQRVTCSFILAVMMCFQHPTFLVRYGATNSRSRNIFMWLACVTAVFFFARMTFASASLFVRCLVVRNARAFEWLNEKAVFVRNEPGAQVVMPHKPSVGNSVRGGIASKGISEIVKHAPSTVPSTPAQDWEHVLQNFLVCLEEYEAELESEAELLDMGQVNLLYQPLSRIDPVKGLRVLREQNPNLDLSNLEEVDPETLGRATILMLSVSLER